MNILIIMIFGFVLVVVINLAIHNTFKLQYQNLENETLTTYQNEDDTETMTYQKLEEDDLKVTLTIGQIKALVNNAMVEFDDTQDENDTENRTLFVLSKIAETDDFPRVSGLWADATDLPDIDNIINDLTAKYKLKTT